MNVSETAPPMLSPLLEGQPQARPPPLPLVGITRALTPFNAELIATLERTAVLPKQTCSDVISDKERKLLGPLTTLSGAATTILPSEKGTAISDVGVSAALERVFKELAG